MANSSWARQLTSPTHIGSFILMLCCVFLLLNKATITYVWNLSRLQAVTSFNEKLKYGNHIASLVDKYPNIASNVGRTLKDHDVDQRDKTFIVSSLFVPSVENDTAILMDLRDFVSGDVCGNADIVHHVAAQAFEHKREDIGWKFFALADDCSHQCPECMMAAFSILSSVPNSEMEIALSKLKIMAKESSSTLKLATITYYNWIETGKTSNSLLSKDADTSTRFAEIEKLSIDEF